MLQQLSSSDMSPDNLSQNPIKLSRDLGAWLTGGLLLILAAVAWLVLLQQAGMGMAAPASGDGMAEMWAWPTPGAALAYLGAWGVMMAAMMLPSAIPMIALYGAMQRRAPQKGQLGLPAALFTLVYLAAWVAFGIPVYAASVLLDWAASTNPALAGLLPYGVALVLLGAGVYQLTPLKRACLRACQSPIGFLMGHWHTGVVGTIRLAWEHATYCLGCCAALMVVLVAAGAMSLPWVLLIAALVFIEKVLPRGQWTARVIGVGLVGLGLWVVVRPDVVMMLRGAGM